MKWNYLTTEAELENLVEKSAHTAQVIFKYSGRCSISDVAKTRLERKTAPLSVDFYLVDVIEHRALSNKIARDFGVQHESPQILIIKNAECVYDESHLGIRMDEIAAQSMAA